MSDVQPTSRYCFVCGRDNPASLGVRWRNDPGARQVRAVVTVREEYNGYPGIVHGGVVAALLDETAGRALMVDGDFERLWVTVKLEVTYRRPTPTGVPLTVVGWVEREDARRSTTAAEIRLPDGEVTARCKALIARPPETLLEGWLAEREHWRVDPE
ncbi:MAG: PaaI family thioesterase [Acidobacteria bacterium]|nr:MAG: PaaI family thioesterase [Acidobacteriota bacterium]